ncbi:MAG: acido-empty-quinoprotein group A, partial [Acidobacteriaceae bacterium]|nr:acido-empty-quinoprotein group A [Acidobacteriaceae bacterium]
MKLLKTVISLVFAAAPLFSQFLDPAKLQQPPTDSWPTYNGDYSGRRFSTLSKVNAENINSLSLAWVYRINVGSDNPGGSIKATPLLVNGVLYFTLPDHVWAVDARTGHELWNYNWQSKGGIHLGNRG